MSGAEFRISHPKTPKKKKTKMAKISYQRKQKYANETHRNANDNEI